MVKVSLKNTFLSFEEEDSGEELPRATMQKAASPRSRSAECHSPNRVPAEPSCSQIEKLNRLLGTDQPLSPALGRSPAMSPLASGQQSPTYVDPSPTSVPPRPADRPEQLRAGSVAAACVSTEPAAAGPHPPFGPTVQELRTLQRRLEEGLSWGRVRSEESLDGSGSAGPSSARTLFSAASQVPRVCSRGSVSTMADRESLEDGEEKLDPVEFVMTMEESSTRGCSASPPGAPVGSGPARDADAAPRGAPGRRPGGSAGPAQQCRPLPREYLHSQVPKNMNLEEEYRNNTGRNRESATTMMIRNLPNRYTQRELISELEDLGFAGTFDFLYLPLDKGTMYNVGYAFVNFVEPDWAQRCIAAFQNYRFKQHRRMMVGRMAAVSVAHIQGLEANLAHYEKAAVSSAKLKQRRPLVMANISSSLSGLLSDEN